MNALSNDEDALLSDLPCCQRKSIDLVPAQLLGWKAAANFMTFWEAFFRVILLRPGQALRALYWHLTRRRVRARNQIRRGAALLPNAHYFWIRAREEQPDYARRLSELGQRQPPPTFEIVLSNGGDFAAIERSLKSLENQKYPHWQLCVASPRARVLPEGLASSANLRSIEAEGSALFDAVQAVLR